MRVSVSTRSASCLCCNACAVLADTESAQVGYDLTGAMEGTCDITFDDGPLAVLASELADPLRNTSNFALDEPLAMGVLSSLFP